LVELIESFDENGDGLIDDHEFENYYEVFFNSSVEADGHEGHDHKKRAENVTECPLAATLFSEFAVNDTLGETEFRDITVEMTYYRIVEGCKLHQDAAFECPVNKQEAWVWAILASLGITVFSAVGVVLLPVSNKKAARYLFQGLLGLSAGTMFGDAVLHLLPHAFEPAFEMATHEESHTHVLKLGLLTLASMFLCVLVEKGFLFVFGLLV
jgi:hypothetical protein